jgi:4-hydroxymandelate oxidase
LLNPADVPAALNAGVSGIIVSNHGGRVLDTLPATIDVLPAVAAAVAGAVPILLDGGVRRGTDIVKAIALGASAVLLGQPVLHALAVGGMPGVVHMLTLLQTELEAAMALLGRPTLRDIDASTLMGRTP